MQTRNELRERMREAFVKAYPDKFKSLEDLPLEKMLTTLEKEGITTDDYMQVSTPVRFSYTIDKAGITLEGRVLDLCSASISIASVYDKEKVVCYEFMTDMVEKLSKKGVKTVQANIRDKYFPFKNKSFDYLFCEGFPLAPYTNKDFYESSAAIADKDEYVKNVIKEMIRVTKKKVIICSIPIMMHFPKKYEKRIEKWDGTYCIILLDCRKNYKKKKI